MDGLDQHFGFLELVDLEVSELPDVFLLELL